MKLRTSQYLVVVASIVPFLAVAAAMVYLQAGREQDLARTAAQERVRALMSAVDAELLAIVGRLHVLGESQSLVEGDLDGFRKEALRAVERTRWISIVLLSPEGAQLVNTAVASRGALLPKPIQPDSFRVALLERRPVVGGLGLGKTVEEFAFVVRVPVEINGRVLYILSANVRPRDLQPLLVAQRIDGDGVMALIDNSGHFIARTPYLPPSRKVDDKLLSLLKSTPSGWFHGITEEGTEAFAAHVTSELSGWMLGEAIPVKRIHAAVWHSTWIALLGLAATTLIAALSAYWLARRVEKPMSELARSSRSLFDPGATEIPAAKAGIEEVDQLRDALREAAGFAHERHALVEREKNALREADVAKTQFLAMLSHELRNPLAALSLAASILKDSSADARVVHQSRIIDRQTRNMARLVQDLLDLSRLATGKVSLEMSPLDAGSLAAHVAGIWQASGRLAKRRLQVHAETAWVAADIVRLEQVLSNLIENAVKFSPDSSTIDVAVRKDGPDAVISVTNEGKGIPPEMASQVFELFVQAPHSIDQLQGGMGIGLAVVKQLVELQGGRVSVEPKAASEGTTFTLTLPLTGSPAEPDSPVAAVESPKLHVVVVDDNDDFRESLVDWLQARGHEVSAYGTGSAALSSADFARASLVFVDIGLPDMRGDEVAARIRAQTDRPLLVAVSGYDPTPGTADRFDLYFNKPLTDEVIRRVLAKAEERQPG